MLNIFTVTKSDRKNAGHYGKAYVIAYVIMIGVRRREKLFYKDSYL